MQIVKTIKEAQAWCDAQTKSGKSIGFVPTMGYLHDGHMSLIDQAKDECDLAAASIFVNPTQFGVGEDLERYPRNFERDCSLLEEHGCDLLFAPDVPEMYPSGFLTHLRVGVISASFEGHYRPTHFDGVCLIVMKLVHAVKAQVLYLGQKDYQQTLVVAQMLRDLNYDIDLRIGMTVREADGLALSSRNVYLSEAERSKATVLHRALLNVQRAVGQNIRNKTTLDSILQKTLLEAGEPRISIDYASCVLASNLQEQDDFNSGDRIVCLIAVRLGKTRLIDNMILSIP